MSRAPLTLIQTADTPRHLSSACAMGFHKLADLLPNDPEGRARAKAHARRRGMNLEQPARRILEAVIEDDIVAAVLDDERKAEDRAFLPVMVDGEDRSWLRCQRRASVRSAGRI